jgi:hypothetical protein
MAALERLAAEYAKVRESGISSPELGTPNSKKANEKTNEKNPA